MPNILDLPNELIFDIIDLALSTSLILNPPDAKRCRRGEDNKVCYIDSDAAYQPNALALLLACKQLNAQTALYISKSPRICELDIALVDAIDLFPTWRYIPTRNGSAPAMLDKVVVNLIPCCHGRYNSLRDNWPRPTTSPVNDSSRLWAHRLFSTIEQYFAMGALSKDSKTMKFAEWSDYPTGKLKFICTHTLVIKADTHKKGTDVALGVDAVPVRQLDEEAYGSFGALYPINPGEITKIMHLIAYIITQKLPYTHNYHEMYCVMFAIERVGRIEFYVDGELFREIDVGDY
jgi:hypothetical protein